VNAEYLCVRGRFGHEFVNASERLTTPLVNLGQGLQPSRWEEAVAFAAAQLREIAATHGPGSVAFLGGEKLALEEQYLFGKLARAAVGTPHVDSRTRLAAPLPGTAILAATGGGRPLVSFAELGRCEEVLVLGEDLQGENPFAQSVLIRGQHQNGLHLIVAHPRRVKLARGKFGGLWLHHRPGAELAVLAGLGHLLAQDDAPAGLPAEAARELPALRQALAPWTPDRVARESGVERADLEDAARRLRAASRKAILFGRALVESPQAAALLPAVETLGWLCGALGADRSAVMYLGPQNNSQGALDAGLAPDLLPGYIGPGDAAARNALERQWGRALPAGPGLGAPEILRAAAAGEIKALWVASDNWLRSAPDRALAEQALERCDLVIVNELFMTETARRAHVVFPVASFAEKEGVYVNAERRLQKAASALPRRNGARSDLEVFLAVARELGAGWNHRSAEDVFRELARLSPILKGVSLAALLPLGPQWPVGGAAALLPARLTAPAASDGPPLAAGELWLLSGAVLFQHGTLGQRSELLRRLAGRAAAFLHPAEAQALGVAAGNALELAAGPGRIVLPVQIDDAVPRGAVFVPYAFPEVEINRLGFPEAAGRPVRARRAAAAETTVG
jgi:formate dehydrogenase major subunit